MVVMTSREAPCTAGVTVPTKTSTTARGELDRSRPDRGDSPGGGWRGLLALVSVAFISTYLFGSANVVLPWIGASLGASQASMAMVLGGYAITFAALQIWFGRVGDNVGRRLLLRWGLIGIVVTSLVVSAAGSIWILIVLRFAQGVAVAAAMPQLLSTIQATTAGAARARAVAAYGAASGLGGGVGVVLGGALTELDLAGLSWRPVLGSTAIFGALALALSRYVPETFGRERASLDLAGTGMLTAALVALISALSMGPSLAWPAWSLGLLVFAVLGLIGFWWYERRQECRGVALVPPSVVSLPPVAVGLTMALLFFAGYGAFMYEWAQFTRQALHSTALVSGLGLGGFCVAFVLGNLSLARITRVLGQATMVTGGVLQLTALLALIAVGMLAPDRTWVLSMQLPTFLLGLAQALQFGPLVQTVMAGVPDRVAGLTGGLISTAQQAAFALGVATIGAAFFLVTDVASPRLGWATGIGLQVLCTSVFTALALWLRRRVLRAASST